MDALEHARAEIDEVDAQLAALFERRMAAVLLVAEYKRAHGLPIFDAAREAAVLEKAAARIHAPALRPYYKDHVQNMMDVAKQYEALILGQNRAAYQGVEGAFAHIALRALFPHAEAVSCPTWDEVFAAVERGDAAHGVVPFENSHAGDVSAVLDLCYNHPDLWVVDVYDLPISQNLLVLPGTQLAEIRSVYSHQQAIAQSETFLKQFHLPATAMLNTAMAAKFVAESGDKTKAAIASAETAALYGLVKCLTANRQMPLRTVALQGFLCGCALLLKYTVLGFYLAWVAVLAVLNLLLSPARWAGALIGMVCISVPMLLLCLAIPGAFGGGDIKLMAAAGLFLGWQHTLLAMFFGILGGGFYGMYLLAARKADKKDHFAFGPFLCVGIVLALLFGDPVLAWYCRFL